MNLQAALFMTIFLGIFQAIGGTAFGYGLRALRSGVVAGFMLIWGAGFGGIPLLIGTLTLLTSRYPLMALIGPLLFLAAIGFSVFVWPRLTQDFGAATIALLGFGLIFLIVGLGVGAAMLAQREYFFALVFGGVFSLVGALCCAQPIGALIHGKTLGE